MFTKKVVLALLVAFCGSAQADSSEMVSLAFEGADEVIVQPLSCEEARLTAWFERERQRSDGGQVDTIQFEPCQAEQPAEVSTSDED